MTGRVAAFSRDLASASLQQAASLEDTSASLAQVNRIVTTNARHAHEARGRIRLRVATGWFR